LENDIGSDGLNNKVKNLQHVDSVGLVCEDTSNEIGRLRYSLVIADRQVKALLVERDKMLTEIARLCAIEKDAESLRRENKELLNALKAAESRADSVERANHKLIGAPDAHAAGVQTVVGHLGVSLKLEDRWTGRRLQWNGGGGEITSEKNEKEDYRGETTPLSLLRLSEDGADLPCRKTSKDIMYSSIPEEKQVAVTKGDQQLRILPQGIRQKRLTQIAADPDDRMHQMHQLK